MEAAGIPLYYAPILDELRLKSGASEGLYARCLDPIDLDTWTAFWRKSKKGTAPGLSGETSDMLASLPEHRTAPKTR